jgi:hypothetical protein
MEKVIYSMLVVGWSQTVYNCFKKWVGYSITYVALTCNKFIYPKMYLKSNNQRLGWLENVYGMFHLKSDMSDHRDHIANFWITAVMYWNKIKHYT